MASEMRGFIFCIAFILVFAGLVHAMPSGFQGIGSIPDIPTPVDPSITAGWEETANWTRADCTPYGLISEYKYEYDLGARSWLFDTLVGGTILTLGAKILYAGFWFGQLDSCEFIAPDGDNIGYMLAFSDINADSTNGTTVYDLHYLINGQSAGDLVFYWNDTLYSDCEDAWNNDTLYIMHGVGFGETATTDIGSLLVSLLTLQLPDIPVEINFLIAAPLYGAVSYLIWYIIKEMFSLG